MENGASKGRSLQSLCKSKNNVLTRRGRRLDVPYESPRQRANLSVRPRAAPYKGVFNDCKMKWNRHANAIHFTQTKRV